MALFGTWVRRPCSWTAQTREAGVGTGVSGPSPLGPEGWGGVRLERAGSVLVGTEMVAEAEVLASTQQFPPYTLPRAVLG